MARIIDRLAVFCALLGGAVLMALIVLVCVSVAGRGLGSLSHSGVPGLGWAGPVTGDFEIVEAAMAFAIFAFLPLCQLRAGHATVDLFTRPMGPRVTRALALFWEGVFALILGVIAWRLGVSTLEKMCIPERFTGAWCSIETSFLIGFPIWWSYLACLVVAVIATLTALWCVMYRILEGDLPARPQFEETL